MPFDDAWATLREKTRWGGPDTRSRALQKLASAAHHTALRQFFPYTSHHTLNFARSPYPFEDVQRAFVAISRHGTYLVMRGSSFHFAVHGRWPGRLRTKDPDEAVTALLHELGLVEATEDDIERGRRLSEAGFSDLDRPYLVHFLALFALALRDGPMSSSFEEINARVGTANGIGSGRVRTALDQLQSRGYLRVSQQEGVALTPIGGAAVAAMGMSF